MIVINMGESVPIRFGLTGVEELVQNVRTILSSIQGTVPLDREFGIPVDAIDEPIPIARARLTTEIMTAILEREPRVTVSEVRFLEDHPKGRLVPIVHIDPVIEEVT